MNSRENKMVFNWAVFLQDTIKSGFTMGRFIPLVTRIKLNFGTETEHSNLQSRLRRSVT